MPIATTAPSPNVDPAFFVWVAVLVAVVVAGGIILTVIRRRFRAEAPPKRQGFTLHDVREMHRRGELSDDEFEQAREAILRQVGTSKNTTGDDADDQ